MALVEEDIAFIKRHLGEWLTHFLWLVGFIATGVMVVIGAMRYL